MSSQNFVIGYLLRMGIEYPFLQIQYEFDELDKSHLISLKQVSGEENLMQLKIELVRVFVEKFPCENIIFVDKRSLIQIENPNFVFQPLQKLSEESLNLNASQASYNYDIHSLQSQTIETNILSFFAA
ncbi:hypothetical protein [Raineya orbicola]|jgi:hypothetical protein|uniref:Uncharacterized protein n=1 Tax=Raineya orbicola TaxID=2016530 RepID=A0A2N3IEY1_9BACT|nr:hypothetical protein [Raineya orbicola]PKQ68892.1 hypothetical protein Rain11_1547 [Raineya orbicola]